MKSKEYFKEVYKKSSKLQQVSLDNIKMVCDDLEKRGIWIRVKFVGKECLKRFGKTGWNTIKGSSVLKAYISLRIKEQNVVIEKTEDIPSDILEHYEYLKLENRKLREMIKNNFI